MSYSYFAAFFFMNAMACVSLIYSKNTLKLNSQNDVHILYDKLKQ